MTAQLARAVLGSWGHQPPSQGSVEQAGFAVLKSRIPSILVETHSSQSRRKKRVLNDADYKKNRRDCDPPRHQGIRRENPPLSRSTLASIR